MERCPSCGQAAFSDGWCTYCGYTAARPAPPRVVVGQPLPDPLPLDPAFIAEAEPLPLEALEALPLEALQVIEGEPEAAPLPLDALALVEGEGEPLVVEELEPEPLIPRLEGLETMERIEIEVTVGLEGLETTELDTRGGRGARDAEAGGPQSFQYKVCPGCQAEQPEPPPTFCENCGERLKLKSRSKAKEDADRIKCRECGVPNRPDAGHCINCGFKLAVGI